MTTLSQPIDIQAQLDAWLEGNQAAQKYVSKLWYLRDDEPPPPDVTHTIRLASILAADRALVIGIAVVPPYAVMLDAILALVATQPPA